MPRLREKKRLREQRILGIKPGIPTYIPPELIARGFKLKFYDTADVKIGEIGSDVKTGKISTVNFELMGLGCAAFSFVIDEMPKIFKYEIDVEDESLVGYWPMDEGSGITAYDQSGNENDGTLYPTPVPINACDAVTDWFSQNGSLSIDTEDKKEGTGSLKDIVADPAADTWHGTYYNPAGSWDWSAKKHVLFWLQSDRPSTAFTTTRFRVLDTLGNYRYWDITFSAGEWTAFKIPLHSDWTGQTVTPPDLALITEVRVYFRTADTTPFYKKLDFLRIDDRPVWTDGKVGKALDLDGVDDLVNVPDNESLDITEAITITTWVNTTDGGAIIDKGTAYMIETRGGGKIRFVISSDWGGDGDLLGNTDIRTGEWVHIAVTYDRENLRLFINGVEEKSQSCTIEISTNAAALIIGYRQYPSEHEYFNGIIDEVLIYKRALTATEVKALYELKVGKYVDAFDMAYRTRVDIHPYFDESPWFTGFIQTLPQQGQKKPFEYSGFGFFDQLDWVTVTGSYENDDVAVIVKDIIQNTVAPNTQIIYNASKVQSPSYTVIKIEFDHTLAKDAIQTLADMAQGYEFGVDGSREFYFRPIDTAVHHNYWMGKHFQDAEIEKNPFTVRNKLYIKIGEIQAGGSNIIGSVQDNDSITLHGLREEVVNVPESLNPTDAQRWAADILARMKDPEVKAKIKSIFLDESKTKIEAKGKVKITAHDGTKYTFFIKRVAYAISPAGILGDVELE